MPTDLKVQDHYVLHFTTNVELLLQQKQPRLAGATTTANYTGEKAQVIKQFGEIEFQPFNAGTAAGQWKGDTVWGDIEHHQRWVFPADYARALPAAKGDDMRMLGDPRSTYAEAMRAAYARRHDDIVIAAALGVAKTGRYDDLKDTALPATQLIDLAGGLTIDKLLAAKEKLIAAGNDPSEERFFACSEKQLNDLLKDTKVQSADYNTVKALVKGELDTFVGFKFISTERLNLAATKRQCFAWVKSGLHVGTWNGLETHIDRRPDKNYAWQIWMSFTMGATRTQEKKVVQVNCVEA